MSYCLYLRKSRADMDAEALGEGETLARHERLLLEVARRDGYDITQIYREIVSGETIASRPVMQHLLSEVEKGLWDGVLVVEVERLARGDTIDQGIVMQTFKYSETKIITPTKVYDPNNEFDEEYFEFGLFMSRREYKLINRRLQQGRIAAIKEGKRVGGRLPYGYTSEKIKNGKGWTLVIDEQEAEIVRLIYSMYATPQQLPDGTYHYVGIRAIANMLTDMGVPTKSGLNDWSHSAVRSILTNPVYVGKMRYLHRITKKTVSGGIVQKKIISSPDDEIVAAGLHPSIIDEDLYLKVAARISSNPPRTKADKVLKNPLSGILLCKICKKTMRVSNNNGVLFANCRTRNCPCSGSNLSHIEDRILKGLKSWLNAYHVSLKPDLPSGESRLNVAKQTVSIANQKIARIKAMITRTHELLEQGVYDTETFLERSRTLSVQLKSAETKFDLSLQSLHDEHQREANKKTIVPKVEKLLDSYYQLPSAQEKNDILKEVLEKVEYFKDKSRAHRKPFDDFELDIFPKYPPTD